MTKTKLQNTVQQQQQPSLIPLSGVSTKLQDTVSQMKILHPREITNYPKELLISLLNFPKLFPNLFQREGGRERETFEAIALLACF